MVDEFIWGKVQRISPEAPVPVVEVMDETYRLGGSGNVAANIKTMGGVPIPIAVHGHDDAARRLTDLLKQWEIDNSGLTTADRPTTLTVDSIRGQLAQCLQAVRACLAGGQNDDGREFVPEDFRRRVDRAGAGDDDAEVVFRQAAFDA